MLLAATLVFELVRESLTGAHYRYREYENGLPTDTYITTKTALNVGRASARPQNSRMVDGRIIHRSVITDAPFKPWQEDRDAITGALIRRTPLFFNAKPARVFDPNPVVTLNAPDLQDANDANVVVRFAGAGAARKDVDLPRLLGVAPSAHARVDWSGEPWTRGSYLILGPGQLLNWGNRLSEPHGQLYFGGAERSTLKSYMEGAARGGEDVAREILGAPSGGG